MTTRQKIKREIQSLFSNPRIMCKCGWNNYKYSIDGYELKRCVHCGVLLDEDKRARNEFKNNLAKARRKIEEE